MKPYMRLVPIHQTILAGPVTPTFRFACSMAESLCVAVPIEQVLYRLSSENGAGLK